MKTNIASPTVRTHEGLKIQNNNPFQQLERAVMSCLLWEKDFYEDGQNITKRIVALIPKCHPEQVSNLAIWARRSGNLRHVPLFLVANMAALPKCKPLVAKTLEAVIERPDELSEFLSLYWINGKCPLSAQVKKGLASAFRKFNRFALSKWDKDGGAIKLKDVMRLCHPKPINDEQSQLWKDLLSDSLVMPYSWETEISKRGNTAEVWNELINNKALGGLAFLRNLRNMYTAGVTKKTVVDALPLVNFSRVLPFRFISASRQVPTWEDIIEKQMLDALKTVPKLPGKTALIIDTSPSMWMANVSAKSDISRFDAAAALSILLREICSDIEIYAFNSKAYTVPPRHGFALRDALAATKDGFSCGSLAVELANKNGYDRIICLTDGQWHATKGGKPVSSFSLTPGEKMCKPLADKPAYMLNVSTTQNGVGYGDWTVINGFSESVVSYIAGIES